MGELGKRVMHELTGRRLLWNIWCALAALCSASRFALMMSPPAAQLLCTLAVSCSRASCSPISHGQGGHIAIFAYGWWKQARLRLWQFSSRQKLTCSFVDPQASDLRLAGLNTLKFSVWSSRGAGLCLGVGAYLVAHLLFQLLRRSAAPQMASCSCFLVSLSAVRHGGGRADGNSPAQLCAHPAPLSHLAHAPRREHLVRLPSPRSLSWS